MHKQVFFSLKASKESLKDFNNGVLGTPSTLIFRPPTFLAGTLYHRKSRTIGTMILFSSKTSIRALYNCSRSHQSWQSHHSQSSHSRTHSQSPCFCSLSSDSSSYSDCLDHSLFSKNGDEERAFFKQYLKLPTIDRAGVGIERLGNYWSELSSTVDQLAALASIDASFFVCFFIIHSLIIYSWF